MARRAATGRDTQQGGDLLVVDVGNSFVKLGLVRQGELSCVWTAKAVSGTTRDEAVCQINSLTATAGHSLSAEPAGTIDWVDSVVSSVVPDLTDAWVGACLQLTGRKPLVVGPGIKTGVPMSYNDPGELGADLIANLAAAMALYSAPFIVVDLGTTTTLQVVNKDGRFVGGIIAPGLQLGAHAASSAAAKLPAVDLRTPSSVIGKNTREAMQSGFVLGQAAMIDGLVNQCWTELGYEGSVVLTGHNAETMAALCSTTNVHRQYLTLEGLVRLHGLNR